MYLCVGILGCKIFFKYNFAQYKHVNEFLSSSIGGHSTYCVMHRIKNNDEVFGLMKAMSLVESMSFVKLNEYEVFGEFD